MENKWTRIEAIRKALADRPAILRTHWEGCETEARHADCAIAFLLDEIERRDAALRALVERLAHLQRGDPADEREAGRMDAQREVMEALFRLLEHEP